MTREEHLAWCKQRAKEYLGRGDTYQAWLSLTSDLSKHDGTRGHIGIELGMRLVANGHLNTVDAMRRHIEGFN